MLVFIAGHCVVWRLFEDAFGRALDAGLRMLCVGLRKRGAGGDADGKGDVIFR